MTAKIKGFISKKYFVFLVTICCIFIMTGCSTVPQVPETINVPVYICPAPPTFNKPDLPIENIVNEDSLSIKLKAMSSTIIIQDSYIDKLEKILNGYKNLSNKK